MFVALQMHGEQLGEHRTSTAVQHAAACSRKATGHVQQHMYMYAGCVQR